MSKDDRTAIELGWTEVVPMILASKGITAGLWRFALKLRMGGLIMQAAEATDSAGNLVDIPAGVVGIESILMQPADAPGPMVFDAGVFHAAKAGRKKAKVAHPAGRAVQQTMPNRKPVGSTITAPLKRGRAGKRAG